MWRIVLASILAEVISELVDTEAYHWFVTKVTKEKQWARVLVSNSASIPIDTAIFALVAFGGTVRGWWCGKSSSSTSSSNSR
ncbi:MAG: VUT family protein [Chloroflexi bacterium]|nr:VUT family protein [Chloroflexota bacterium]